jgi:hypothetical protein
MSPDQIRDLWSRFLGGENLPPESQRELVDALEADPGLRESLVENLQLDGILREMNAAHRNGEAFVRTLTGCIGAEHDADSFVRKVESRLNESSRRIRPPSASVFRRRPASRSSGDTGWTPALVAAAAFVAILLLVDAPSREPRAPVAKAPLPAIPPAVPVEAPPKPEVVRAIPTNPEIRPEAPAKSAPEESRVSKVEDAPKNDPAPEPKPPVVSKTIAEAVEARIVVERVEGNVTIARSKSDKPRARKDDVLGPGQTIETHSSSAARLRFADGTWFDLGPGSSFTKSRQLFLAAGSLESKVAPQPPDGPMIFTTPTGEVTILGTTVRLTVGHEARQSTTLEVREGKAMLTRLADRRSVPVAAGQFAVAVPGVDLAAQKSFPDELLVKFGPSDVQLQPGWVLDSGDEFDPARGYGWIGPKNGPVVPGLFWRDGQGKLQPRHRGRIAVRRAVPPGTDPLKATDVTAGWATQSETWFMPVPNGRYLISVCCGDLTYEQGPHHVWVEGVQVIDQKKNRVGESIEVKDVPVDVRDGELTMKVGGNPPGSKVSSDGSSDSCINYLLIKRIRK